nr:molybdenum cofactor guanylyltransferase [Acidipila sp. EB88]
MAGGQSSRMGRDKSQLLLGGVTLLEHGVRRLRALGFAAAVAGLRAGALPPFGTPVVADAFEECGPLGGMEAALRSLASLPAQPVLFVAVDLPLLPAALLEQLWQRALCTGALATVPYLVGRPQPLCAVYHSSLAAGFAEALAREDRKIMRVLESLVPLDRFDRFRVEALAATHQEQPAAGPMSFTHAWFANANTPEDWQRIVSASDPGVQSFVPGCTGHGLHASIAAVPAEGGDAQ